MRDPDIVEAELADIAAIQDDVTKAERIVTWAAMHPSEVGFAIKMFTGRADSLHHWAQQNPQDADTAEALDSKVREAGGGSHTG